MDKTKIPRLMIVTGDDSPAIEQSRQDYLKRVRSRHGQCAVEVFDPQDERIGDFMSRAMTPSLFQEIRVCCVLHVQSLAEKDLAVLDKALSAEIPDVYLFISAEFDSGLSADKKKAAEAKVGKALRLKERRDDESVSVRDCSRPPDYKIKEWLVEQAPLLFDRHIGMAEAEFLAETVEYDLLLSELRKIDIALDPGARIDMRIIKEIVGATRSMNAYQLAAALGRRDLAAALNVLDSLSYTQNFTAPPAVAAVFRHFWDMLRIRKFLDRRPNVLKQFNTKSYGKDSPQWAAAIEIGMASGVLTEKTKGAVFPKIIKSGIVKDAQSFSVKGLREVLGLLQRFDVDVKTGRAEPVLPNLQMLCYRIARAA